MYKILDFCPFCGTDLKRDRIKTKKNNKHILKYIKMWRDEGIGKIGPYRTKCKITRYGINCYDSYNEISEILAKKYLEYDNSFGVDSSGSVYSGANFITVEKLLKLAMKHEFYKLFDYIDWCDDDVKISNDEIVDYFFHNFSQKKQFKKDDFEILKSILVDIFWNMFHSPECFDELLEN
jgi:predicted transcriptional regulator